MEFSGNLAPCLFSVISLKIRSPVYLKTPTYSGCKSPLVSCLLEVENARTSILFPSFAPQDQRHTHFFLLRPRLPDTRKKCA
jgi:hypothetical protein